MKATVFEVSVFAICLGARLLSASPAHLSWNPKAAAAYLDRREGWWMAWPPAVRDHGTFCISCHTALPYALARPALREVLAEQGPAPNERKLLESVTKRVHLWKDVKPFYGDELSGAEKRLQSLGTEAVLNALILASSDASNGGLSDTTRTAFGYMWKLQQQTGDARGSWLWLNFSNEPWEANDSGYYGACLAAAATGIAPESYRTSPDIQSSLKSLGAYLNRESVRQSSINRVAFLWASAKVPGLLDRKQQEAIIQEVLTKQRDDGGWSLSSLAWTWKGWSLFSLAKLWIRSDGTPLDTRSDGYATGLIALALEQAGLPREDVHVQRALAWLMRNQDQSRGSWVGLSLNKRHDPYSGTGQFMSDAATAYAVLALTQDGKH